MQSFDPTQLAFWSMIGSAVFCGAVVGGERQWRRKPAGMRTSMLVCLGTAVFVRLGMEAGGGADPTRALGQVVTGVGFLGAGVIINRDGFLTGVTTAAVIWVLAAIGAAIGSGQQLGGIVLSLVVVSVILGTEWLDKTLRALREREMDGEHLMKEMLGGRRDDASESESN